jgi:deoxyribodipyrimidine photo-lyase
MNETRQAVNSTKTEELFVARIKRIIWHWKHFDLIAPLIELCNRYGQNTQVSGLITKDSIGSPDEQGTSFLGIPRISENRYHYYHDCVSLLQDQYRDRGYELMKSSEGILSNLAKLGMRPEKYEIWHHPHIGSEERAFISYIEKKSADNVTLKPLQPNTLIAESELPFPLDLLPDTFSKFRKKIEKRPYASYEFARYPHDLSTIGSAGRKHLGNYVFRDKKILTYKKTRNGLGPGDYSSRLSKWLAVNTIRASEVGSAILHFEDKYIKNESTYWLLFELLWRDYFHFLHRKVDTLLFMPTGIKSVQSPGLQDEIKWTFPGSNYQMTSGANDCQKVLNHWKNFRKWARGKTGESFVDVMMQELFFTGEISNRARQCAASYLIHDLHVPWWWGAQWFEHLLLDYDVSSNWGNWAYIAGVGVDPRSVRKFNMQIQAQKYDSNGAYRKWGLEQNWEVPEDALPEEFPGTFHEMH